MQTLLSTISEHPKSSFRRWREAVHERIVPVELRQLSDRPFVGTLEAADIGGIPFTRVTQSAMRTEATSATIRRHTKQDTLSVVIAISGEVRSTQNDRATVQRPGDIVVLERRPAVMTTRAESQTLLLEVPRARLESELGASRHFSTLTIGAEQASTTLVTGFIGQLARVHRELPSDVATRMASVGVDLLIACIADRLARETPLGLHSTILVQRAKAHVEAHLSDPRLDPPQLAVAVGISLRRLQELFHERGQHISEWIWKRRLDVAAERLADPQRRHMAISALAYGCGFISQSHFSRRFRDRFGMPPSEYRARSMRKPQQN